MFPEMGVSLVIIHFGLVFSMENHPAMGVPPRRHGNPQKWIGDAGFSDARALRSHGGHKLRIPSLGDFHGDNWENMFFE